MSEELEEFLKAVNEAKVISREEFAELRGLVTIKEELSATEFISAADVKALAKQIEQNSEEADEKSGDLRYQISKMNLSHRLKLALYGDFFCRFILIRSTNRMIQVAVLNNPRIRDAEIEAFAKNPNVSTDVLKTISNRKKWMKRYALKLNLVMNPKSPTYIALRWIPHLRKPDLRKLARSKDLPAPVVSGVRKRLAALEEAEST